MSDDPIDQVRNAASTRQRNQTACEACRATKIKCTPSEQPGVCRKCLDSKKECVLRTGPRTRRSRRPKPSDGSESQESNSTRRAPASGTFSIDFAMTTQPEMGDTLDILRETHEVMIDAALPHDDYLPSAPDLVSPSAGSLSTVPTSASTPGSTSIEALQGKPQFNLSSAESLLSDFRSSMLSSFPCIILDRQEAVVPRMASTRPFVLLAILATAAGSKALQGHSLYDDEFRKVLALKFVAGGERTLELLQGILIYCAWYPFHLRPRNKQAFQYIRMAGDLVQDLELEHEVDLAGSWPEPHQLDNVRAYIAYCSLVTKFMSPWRKWTNLNVGSTSDTLKACAVLETWYTDFSDLALVALARVACIGGDVAEVVNGQFSRSEQESRLLILGLEAQAEGVREDVLPEIADMTPVKLALLFIDIYPNTSGLLYSPRPRGARQPLFSMPIIESKITATLPSLRMYLQEAARLDPSAYIAFTVADWDRFVLMIILSFRLSFPLPECPSFNHVSARAILRLDEILGTMCAEDPTTTEKKVDVLSASKTVLQVVKAKYDRRIEAERRAEELRPSCPLLDGSLDEFLPLWDAKPMPDPVSLRSWDSAGMEGGEGGGVMGQQPVFHDLWATMTMGWTEDSSHFCQ